MNRTVDVVPSPYNGPIRSAKTNSDVILGSCRPRNQRGSRVLDLHFVEKNVSVLRQLDLSRTVY